MPLKKILVNQSKKKQKSSKINNNIKNNSKESNENKVNFSDKKANINKDILIDSTSNKEFLIDNTNNNNSVTNNNFENIDFKANSEINQKILNTDENSFPKNKKIKKKYKNSRFNKQMVLKTENVKKQNDLLINIKNKNTNSKDKFIPTFNNILKKPNYKASDNDPITQKIIQNNLEQNQQNAKFFEEYLSTAPDDMDYDDAVYKDKRTFWEYFLENFIEDQIIATTFIHFDPLKTRTMKIMLFILNIILYFLINGLFFSESYISKVYNLNKKEGFFDFFPRSINRLFYTTVVSIIVAFIVDLFFVEEKKIKGIFKREKDDKIVLKEGIINLLTSIQKRFLLFIIIVYVIIFISLFYFLCFNYVYPKTQIEWIKSSIAMMIIMQFLSIFKVLLETALRFLSFRFKSERIYKISKLID